jgi:hypothetical protein
VGRVIANRYAEIANTRRLGGQSEVFKASDLHQGGRPVAVKIVPATSTGSTSNARQRRCAS